MTCLPALLTASAVIAASLLGGCSDNAIGTGRGQSPAPPLAAHQAAPQSTGQPVVHSTGQAVAQPAGQIIGERLASVALDDQGLSQIRGGFETSSGVVLNFAFQQATFVNHNLVQSVVVPTLTITPGQGTASIAGASPVTGASPPNVNVSSLNGLGVSAQSQPANSSITILPNGTVQTQVSTAAPVVQALVNSGMTSIVSTLGGSGVTSVISNTANNRVVQQMTTINIGVSGLSNLMQQSMPTTVLGRLTGANAFR